MRTDILFKDFKRSEYIENFVTEKIDSIVERLVAPDNDTHVTVRLEKSRERTDQRRPHFQCEIIVKSGMSSKIYKTVKNDRNIFRSIVCSFDSMKTLLGKTHDRLRHDRRRRRAPAFEYKSESDFASDLDFFSPPALNPT
jgi:hypothetical protein